MDRLKVPAPLMIVSDLDQTMVDHDDPDNISLLRFNALWETHYRQHSLLVFSTGRSLLSYQKLKKKRPLLTPDIAIMSVGTEITYGNKMVPDTDWVRILNHKWDRNIVIEETSKFPELIPQPQSETGQQPHKVSFYINKQKAQTIMQVLLERLRKRGLDVKIVYSGGKYFDILSQRAGKGQALEYLQEKFKTEGKLPIRTLVCGDSGNDIELFSIPDVYGVMVNNAQEDLLKWHSENTKNNPKIVHATERCAAAILQAIGHFSLGPNTSPRDRTNLSLLELDNVSPANLVVKFLLVLEKWRRADIEKSEMCFDIMKTDPAGILIRPSGDELPLPEAINVMRSLYGDQKGKRFRIWADQILSTNIGSDTWLVRFNHRELSGDEQQGCVTTAVINIKNFAIPEATIMHMHQTWMEGSTAKDESAWLV